MSNKTDNKKFAVARDLCQPRGNEAKIRSGQGNRIAQSQMQGGIDIGAREIFVAVPPDRDPDPVRKCETFTGDLHQMAEWLVRCGITTVATVYDVLDRVHAVFGEPAGYARISMNAIGSNNGVHRSVSDSSALVESAAFGVPAEGETCAVRSLRRHQRIKANEVIGDRFGGKPATCAS